MIEIKANTEYEWNTLKPEDRAHLIYTSLVYTELGFVDPDFMINLKLIKDADKLGMRTTAIFAAKCHRISELRKEEKMKPPQEALAIAEGMVDLDLEQIRIQIKDYPRSLRRLEGITLSRR